MNPARDPVFPGLASRPRPRNVSTTASLSTPRIARTSARVTGCSYALIASASIAACAIPAGVAPGARRHPLAVHDAEGVVHQRAPLKWPGRTEPGRVPRAARRSGPGSHMHRFDQIYYMCRGTMDLEIGFERFAVGPHSL